MKTWIDVLAFLLLASIGVIGKVSVNRAAPISVTLTLLFFGAGILSSVILIKTEYLPEEIQVRFRGDPKPSKANVLDESQMNRFRKASMQG